MKILFIAPRIPYPLDHGNAVATWELIKYLTGRGHRITFATLLNSDIPQKFLEAINGNFDITYAVKNTDISFSGVLSNLFSATPFTIQRYQSSELAQQLLKLLNNEKFDIVYVDLLQMAYYGLLLKEALNIPVMLRLHTCETVHIKHRIKNEKNLLFKFYSFIEFMKMKRYETATTGFFKSCLVMTKEDEKGLKKLNPDIKSRVVPQGVDTSYFHPVEAEEEQYSLVSVASLTWMPNYDSMHWFINEIFPLVRKAYPETRLYVVGKSTAKERHQLERDGVIMTGFVDDAREYIARSSVYIVPLRVGSGLRMKILHALAMGKAVVSTGIGCEGIRFTPDKEISVADSPDDFANAIINLFENKNKRLNMGEAGMKLVRKYYSWESVMNSIENEFDKVINENRN